MVYLNLRFSNGQCYEFNSAVGGNFLLTFFKPFDVNL